MAAADFCPAVRLPLYTLRRRSDTEPISWGKLSRLPCTAAESTLPALDGYGLRGKSPARPALAPGIRFLSIGSHVCFTLPSYPPPLRSPFLSHYPFRSLRLGRRLAPPSCCAGPAHT